MAKLAIDIASHQAGLRVGDLANLRDNYKIRGAVVKLTEGTNYINPCGARQVYECFKVFGVVCAYHYYHGNAVAEAKYFLTQLKKCGLDSTTDLSIDIEADDLRSNLTKEIDTFFDVLRDAGYKHFTLYIRPSWMRAGRVNAAKLHNKIKLWLAEYGVSQCSMKCEAWQFTETFKGMNLDCSYDYAGIFTNPNLDENHYYSTGKKFKTKPKQMNIYHDLALTAKRSVKLGKGSVIYAEPVKRKGKVYSLKTKIGYMSANTKFVTKVE
ncbi:GH25 family lysozyme [Apilactobacillus xinyiensis]|uniref:GH25 family lysozyme n=1 Tax=Apilactobacillus xinyiensis TaxID=2841032 RepID=UPI00200F8402|nr:GH25 family lysozyme [Apilactobacillus xinyiensis]MCL0330629.1 autolysin [Apilactobacillus xinyiensis]